jgi:hypothetical protein
MRLFLQIRCPDRIPQVRHKNLILWDSLWTCPASAVSNRETFLLDKILQSRSASNHIRLVLLVLPPATRLVWSVLILPTVSLLFPSQLNHLLFFVNGWPGRRPAFPPPFPSATLFRRATRNRRNSSDYRRLQTRKPSLCRLHRSE